MITPLEASIIKRAVGPIRQIDASDAYQRSLALQSIQSTGADREPKSVRFALGVSVMRIGARLAGCGYQLEMSSQR